MPQPGDDAIKLFFLRHWLLRQDFSAESIISQWEKGWYPQHILQMSYDRNLEEGQSNKFDRGAHSQPLFVFVTYE